MGRSERPIYSQQQKKYVFTGATVRDGSFAYDYASPQFIAPPKLTRDECKYQLQLNQVAQEISRDLREQNSYKSNENIIQDLKCVLGKKGTKCVEDLTERDHRNIAFWANYIRSTPVEPAKRLLPYIAQYKRELSLCEAFGIGPKPYSKLSRKEKLQIHEVARNNWADVKCIKFVSMTLNEAIKLEKRRQHRHEAFGDHDWYNHKFFPKELTRKAQRCQRRSKEIEVFDWKKDEEDIASDIDREIFDMSIDEEFWYEKHYSCDDGFELLDYDSEMDSGGESIMTEPMEDYIFVMMQQTPSKMQVSVKDAE